MGMPYRLFSTRSMSDRNRSGLNPGAGCEDFFVRVELRLSKLTSTIS